MSGTITMICVGLAAGYLLSYLVECSRLATARRQAARIGLREGGARAWMDENMQLEFRRAYQSERQRSGRYMRLTTRQITSRKSRVSQQGRFLDDQAAQFEIREAELVEEERQLVLRVKEVDRLAARYARRREQTRRRLLERSGQAETGHREELSRVVVQGIHEEVNRVKGRRLDALSENQDQQARRIIGVAVGRCQVSHDHPLPSSLIHLRRNGDLIELPTSLDLSGLFKQQLDVDLSHDVEAHTLYISHPDGVVREVTRRTLEDLLDHDLFDEALIEGQVARYSEEVRQELHATGKEVLDALQLSAADGLAEPLGRLKFRTSFGQNILYHSIEVAYLCAAIAGEVGLDPQTALRAGLFHDIGKVLDHQEDEGHPQLGARLLAEHGEPQEAIEAARDHHLSPEKQPPYAALVCAADAISAARPGARRESFDNYVKRLERLEMIANSFFGVEAAYAIQSGRELRVLVDPDEVDDPRAQELCQGIAKEIQQQLDFPGRVRVTLIREKRIVEYAR